MSAAPEPRSVPLVPTVPFPEGISHLANAGLGYEADAYTNWIDESMSWKETCFIGDWSPLLLKMRVRGPDALRFFNEVAVNSFATFAVGQAKHIVLCNDGGKVMGEGILMRYGPEDFLFTSTPGVVWAQWCLAQGGYDVEVRDETAERFIFQVQGPESLRVLEELTRQSFREVDFMRFDERSWGEIRFEVLRQGMAGELGYELHGNAVDSNPLWEAIVAAGEPHGIRRLGARAKMVNHVEASFPTPSVDYVPAWRDPDVREFGEAMAAATPPVWSFVSRHTGSFEPAGVEELFFSPVELGWARSIKFDHEFRGRAALEAEVATPRRVLVTLVWDGEDVADVFASLLRPGEPYQQMELPRSGIGLVWADKVLAGEDQVGISLSRCYSYFFREMISLCVIDAGRAEPGTAVTVLWGSPGFPQKLIRATVAPAPYKQDRRRVDVNSLPRYI